MHKKKVGPKKPKAEKHKLKDIEARIVERERAEEEVVQEEFKSENKQRFYHVGHHVEQHHTAPSQTTQPAKAEGPSQKKGEALERITKIDEETKAEILKIRRAKTAPAVDAKKLIQVREILEREERHIQRLKSGKVKGKKRTRLTQKQVVWLRRRETYLKKEIAKLDGWIGKLTPKKSTKNPSAKKSTKKPAKSSTRKPQKGKKLKLHRSKPGKLAKVA